MSELRQDATTGDWVIVAPVRGERPHATGTTAAPPVQYPVYDPACPFCPGNEERLSDIYDETPAEEPPGWATRIVPNKYPAVTTDAALATPPGMANMVRPGFGHHEVIIETPVHNADLVDRSDAEVAQIIGTYRARFGAVLKDPAVRSVFVFRNHGGSAGASVVHPHSQVMALDMVPPRIAARERWLEDRFAETGRCVLCELAETERRAGHRLVDENDGFLAIVPFAATRPFETWILPHPHRASFAEIGDGEIAALAAILRSVLIRLRSAAVDPAYNFMIESTGREPHGARHLHWWLRVLPNLGRPGGFELGSGLAINSNLPEDDAAILHAAGPAQ